MNFYGLASKRTRSAGEPITWTQRTSNFGTAYMAVGAYGSDGNYVITGGYEASGSVPRAITQTDPTGSWSLNTSTGTSLFFDGGLAFDGTSWVTSSTAGGICYTTDPSSGWTALSNSVALSGLAYNGSLFVGGKGNSTYDYYTSATASGTWTQRTSPLGSDRIFAVGWDGTYWVIGGAGGKLYYTTDATDDGSWTAISSPFSGSTVYSLFYGNSYWVAVGASGKIATATSATGTWTLHGTPPFSTDTIRSVYYANGAWAACGGSGKIATCGSNPTGTWTLRTSSFGSSDTLWTIFYGDGYWVCGGGNGEEGLVATATPGA